MASCLLLLHREGRGKRFLYVQRPGNGSSCGLFACHWLMRGRKQERASLMVLQESVCRSLKRWAIGMAWCKGLLAKRCLCSCGRATGRVDVYK